MLWSEGRLLRGPRRETLHIGVCASVASSRQPSYWTGWSNPLGSNRGRAARRINSRGAAHQKDRTPPRPLPPSPPSTTTEIKPSRATGAQDGHRVVLVDAEIWRQNSNTLTKASTVKVFTV